MEQWQKSLRRDEREPKLFLLWDRVARRDDIDLGKLLVKLTAVTQLVVLCVVSSATMLLGEITNCIVPTLPNQKPLMTLTNL